ncbi:MAG: haloacid dehalogenase-like hydrolase [Candidatus Thermoplasmatota archaeon]|nr:haloacid dehalogenase-like hydrolase [Candidatus Thermoplasmatota archaeon]
MDSTEREKRRSIAIILDCDGTIAEDTTSQLIELIGGNSEMFWKQINAKYSEGWDPSLLWMPKLVEYAKDLGKPLCKELFSEEGKKIKFSEGIPECFTNLRKWFKEEAGKKNIELGLKFFIITGGLEDLILETGLIPPVDEIYGCTFHFDEEGKAVQPMSSVTFTEKTRFIFSINKGIEKKRERTDPGIVNVYMPQANRPVPLDKVIYIGDGPTDVPCFTIINRAGGQVIGIRGKREAAIPSMGIMSPFSENYRPRWGPFKPDYTEKSDLILTIKDLLLDMLKPPF